MQIRHKIVSTLTLQQTRWGHKRKRRTGLGSNLLSDSSIISSLGDFLGDLNLSMLGGADFHEFFNIILELKLTEHEKEDLVAYMLCL